MSDDFADAPVLVDGVPVGPEDNTGYTAETGQPVTIDVDSPLVSWFQYTGTGQVVAVDTLGSTVDTYVFIYTGTGLGALTEIAQSDDVNFPTDTTSYLEWDAESGTTYWICVDTYTAGEFYIELNVVPPDPVSFELNLTVTNSPITRAPAAVEFLVSGGVPRTEATLKIDGTTVGTISLNTIGEASGSVPLSIALGTVGDHDLTIEQVGPDGDLDGGDTFTVLLAPIELPDGSGTDTPPTTADTVRWVLQDPAPGGLASYVFPINPSKMTSPHFEKKLTSRRTMLDTTLGGRFHVFERAGGTKEWQFSGYAPTEAMCNALQSFRALKRRFWLIDHRQRAWKVVFNHVDLQPRLQQNVNGVYTDWGHDYTVRALILDPQFVDLS